MGQGAHAPRLCRGLRANVAVAPRRDVGPPTTPATRGHRNWRDSWRCLQRGQTNANKPRADLRTRINFTEHESTSSPLHSSQTLLQSSRGLEVDSSLVLSSRQTRSNVARMSVSTLGV